MWGKGPDRADWSQVWLLIRFSADSSRRTLGQMAINGECQFCHTCDGTSGPQHCYKPTIDGIFCSRCCISADQRGFAIPQCEPDGRYDCSTAKNGRFGFGGTVQDGWLPIVLRFGLAGKSG